MTKPINPAVLGALVREGREAAGLTQTQLAERIGASRFWVAAFEKGKPSVELGLALKAIQALGLAISIGPSHTLSVGTPREPATLRKTRSAHPLDAGVTLDSVIANATLTHVAPSQVVGWPVGTTTVHSSCRQGVNSSCRPTTARCCILATEVRLMPRHAQRRRMTGRDLLNA